MILDAPSRVRGDGKNEGQFKHGWYGTATYHAWNGMINRCTQPKMKHYKHYGGRGISVCPEWRDFRNFLRDMGPRPEGMSLDRINNDGNYEPGNCRWTTREEQRRNRRCTIFIEYQGERYALADFCKKMCLNRHKVYLRLKRGWTLEEAMTIPYEGTRRKCAFWIANRGHRRGSNPE